MNSKMAEFTEIYKGIMRQFFAVYQVKTNCENAYCVFIALSVINRFERFCDEKNICTNQNICKTLRKIGESVTKSNASQISDFYSSLQQAHKTVYHAMAYCNKIQSEIGKYTALYDRSEIDGIIRELQGMRDKLLQYSEELGAIISDAILYDGVIPESEINDKDKKSARITYISETCTTICEALEICMKVFDCIDEIA